VSYQINDYQHYISRLPDGALRTHNVLMRLDRQLALVNEHDVVSDLTPIRESYIQGFEDCRLVQTTTGLSVTCTTLEHHPIGPWRISLLDLSEDGRLGRHRPLSGYHDDQPQKNWLPFTDSRSGELFAIYGYDPFVVLRVDAESGHCEPAIERVHDRDFGIFRGSAGPIDLPPEAGGGRLIIVHQVAFHHLRYYLHRFLRVDDDWNLTAASRPFFFRQRTIEFACGACLSHDNDLLITFGINDREAWLCRVTFENLNAMLRPLPQTLGVFGD
jgi:hypothetical protein